MKSSTHDYQKDFLNWIKHTAELLKQKKFAELDLENLIEEVEAMGRSEKKALLSNLRILLIHLLKWKYQKENRSNSWKASIIEHRFRLQEDLEDSPSLKKYLIESIQENYAKARELAAAETGLSLKEFPDTCPFTIQQIRNSQWWPD